MADIPVICISGGPCGGKSTFLVQVSEWLEKFAIHPLIISETATELIGAGVSPQLLGNDVFQERLFQYALDREEHYLAIARLIEHKQVVILCDRGLLDGSAYMGETAFAQMIEKYGYSRGKLLERYLLVVHFVTAADGAEEYYTLHNNLARSESPDGARLLDIKTQHAWLGHPHHAIIDNSTDFAMKMHRALRALARKLHMPIPTEIERKFLVHNFTPALIPNGARASWITQDYLVPVRGYERRVRRRVVGIEQSYYFTMKYPTDQRGTRIEKERQISVRDYERFLEEERDEALEPIEKLRYNFLYGGKLFELDVFEGNQLGLVILEVELQHCDEPITIPPDFEVSEVTDDPEYKNHRLAERKRYT